MLYSLITYWTAMPFLFWTLSPSAGSCWLQLWSISIHFCMPRRPFDCRCQSGTKKVDYYGCTCCRWAVINIFCSCEGGSSADCGQLLPGFWSSAGNHPCHQQGTLRPTCCWFNLRLFFSNLTCLPKIDLKNADPERVESQIEKVFDIPREDCIRVSWRICMLLFTFRYHLLHKFL